MQDGALRGTVKQMERWGILRQAEGSGPRRALYELDPRWFANLAAAVRSARPLDLIDGQRLLLLDGAVPSVDLDDVAWVVEFARQKRSLLALLDRTPTPVAEHMVAQLRASGIEVDVLETSRRLAVVDIEAGSD